MRAKKQSIRNTRGRKREERVFRRLIFLALFYGAVTVSVMAAMLFVIWFMKNAAGGWVITLVVCAIAGVILFVTMEDGEQTDRKSTVPSR